MVVEQGLSSPINLGSGDGLTIKEIAEMIASITNKDIVWDETKPKGE